MWRTARKPLRVIVVDDHRDTADSLGLVVHALGHHVEVAYDAITALGLARRDSPDVMLIETDLPRIDGIELARRIRRLDGGDDALLIALSGHGDEVTRWRALLAGFDDYFVQPTDPEVLSERLLEGRAASCAGKSG